jgi:polysaccharide pyruvyl transferase WcaK-like protein
MKTDISSVVRLPSRLIRFYIDNRLWRNYVTDVPLITYIGAPHSRNLGDQLLYKAMCKLFAGVSLVPNSPLSVFKGSRSAETLTTLGQVLFCGNRSMAAVMLGGGTLVNDRGFCELLGAYHRPQLPYFIFGSGVRDPEFEGDRLAIDAHIHRMARLVFVRDDHARRCLGRHGIDATVIGDVVLSLGRCGGGRPEGRKIGINLGCDGVQYFGGQQSTNDAVGAFARRVQRRGWQVEFFAMHDFDAREIEAVRRAHGLEATPFWRRYDRPATFLKKIQEFDVVIGQRLHAAVTACAFSVPTISLSYRPKCLSFMESIDMGGYCVRTDTVDESRLTALFERLVAERGDVLRRLDVKAEHYRQLQRESAKQVISNLSAAS